MAIISFLLHFASQHAIVLVPASLLIGGIIGAFIHKRTGNMAAYAMVPIAMVLAMANAFLGSFVNAAFLNATGTYGTAIIIDRSPTGSLLNDQPVTNYEALVTTAQGDDVLTSFTEMSAAIWPIRNQILIPPFEQEFVVKYVPGMERNIVIMADESAYGRRILLQQAIQPVERARRLFEASPDNRQFRDEYRQSLETFIAQQGDNASDATLTDYRNRLEALSAL